MSCPNEWNSAERGDYCVAVKKFENIFESLDIDQFLSYIWMYHDRHLWGKDEGGRMNGESIGAHR